MGRNILLFPGLAAVSLASVSLLWAVPAYADVKAGVDAWSRGDYAAAIRQWQGPAAAGDADAQFNMGQAYKLGHGVNQDLALAEQFFGKAAAQGHMQASDDYGLLLFQRGERAQALPYIRAASDRGDPRAEYLLGIAHFNGDNVPKDWVRAYALVSLARQAGLGQAQAALSQMDQYVPLEQRQQAVVLSAELASQAEATRARQLAAVDLGATVPVAAAPPPRPVAVTPQPVQPRPAPAPASGPWRVQLGVFSVAGNANALWDRMKSRPELAGHAKLLVPARGVTKLQAGGFASREAAQAACSRLAGAGVSCLAVSN